MRDLRGCHPGPVQPEGADAPIALVERLRALASAEQQAALERALADRTETEIVGVRMGEVFALAREHLDAPLDVVRALLQRAEHEARVLGLSILGQRAKRARRGDPWLDEAAALYVAEHDRIVSWDLVDLAAPSVLGRATIEHGTAVLDDLAASADPLRQRSALMGSLPLVRRGRPAEAVRLALGMLGSPAAQLQRTIGAVLREVGKVDRELLIGVLEREAPRMTAIALRVATERLEPAERERLRALRAR